MAHPGGFEEGNRIAASSGPISLLLKKCVKISIDPRGSKLAKAIEREFEKVDNLACKIVEMRGSSLLVLYYPDAYGDIREEDIKDIYDELRRSGHSRANQLESLDVLLHTYGGDPIAAYRISQTIRSFSKHVVFMVPEYALSGGTLMCLCANEIRMGDYAVLSPIDITITSPEQPSKPIALMNIDAYMDFAEDSRERIEQLLYKLGSDSQTTVESDLLCEMVKQVGALNIGGFYRERTFTEEYARILLGDYMFLTAPNKDDLIEKVVNKLLWECPSHDYQMDFNICKALRLAVVDMSQEEFDKTKEFVSLLTSLAKQELICKDIAKRLKMPFFKFYSCEESDDKNANKKT